MGGCISHVETSQEMPKKELEKTKTTRKERGGAGTDISTHILHDKVLLPQIIHTTITGLSHEKKTKKQNTPHFSVFHANLCNTVIDI